VVVNEIGEVAWPPESGVTVCGRLIATPVGALPTQETEKATGALKLPREFTTTLVPTLSPGSVETLYVDGCSEKSGVGAATGVTGASTPTVPEIMTGISVE
jgi:hypothetical protein